MLPLRLSAAGTLLAGLLFALPIPILKHTTKAEYFLYVASKAKQGIYLYRFDSSGPSLTPQGSAGGFVAALPGVTAFAAHPSNKFLYAATAQATISSFAIHKDSGELRLLTTVESTRKEPCFATVEKKGWMLLVSFCGSGNIESFRIEGDGALGESTGVQQHEGANAHPRNIAISPDNFFIFIPDLDKVFQYRFDPNRAAFWPNDPATAAMKAGSGAGRMIFRPDEKFAYVADEAGASVATFSYNRDAGKLKPVDSVSVAGNAAAIDGAIEIDPSGRFLYLANPGANHITVLAIEHGKGTAKVIGQVPADRINRLRIDPTGRYLFAISQASNRIVIFETDPKTGLPAPAGKPVEVPDPSCFQLLPIFSDNLR